MMKLTAKFFHVKNNPEQGLKDAFTLRELIFVQEQGFREEFDDIDSEALHLVLYDGDIPVATGRLFNRTQDGHEQVIGRVAVSKEYRGTGAGRELMALLEKKAQERGAQVISLGAQLRARSFYEKLSYTSENGIYFEEYCPHLHMKKIF